jgi:hypothetical protein
VSEEVLQVDDAVFLDGRWIVLDGLQGRLHRLDSLAVRRESFARRGNGPGELRAPRVLAGAGRTFWVAGVDGRLDRYRLPGRFVERRTVAVPGCSFPDVRDAAAAGDTVYLAVACVRARSRRFLLLAVEPDGSMRTLADQAAPGNDALTLHQPVVAVGAPGVAFGSNDRPCLEIRAGPVPDPSGPAASSGGSACLRGGPVLMTEAMRREIDATVGREARAAGLRLAVSDTLPWLDALFAGDGFLARRPAASGGWSVEALDAPDRSWTPPSGVEVHGSHGRVLLAWPVAEGTALASLPVSAIPWTRR